MMSQDQKIIVTKVYTHLLSHEKRGWDELDDYVDYLDHLTEDELYRESEVLYSQHQGVAVKCQQQHKREECFIPLLIEAVGAILDLYRECGNLHIKNKYILQYYLAMNQADMIIIDGTLMKS